MNYNLKNRPPDDLLPKHIDQWEKWARSFEKQERQRLKDAEKTATEMENEDMQVLPQTPEYYELLGYIKAKKEILGESP